MSIDKTFYLTKIILNLNALEMEMERGEEIDLEDETEFLEDFNSVEEENEENSRKKKILALMMLVEFLESSSTIVPKTTVVLGADSLQWRFRDPACFHTSFIPYNNANFFFTHANDSSLEKVSCFDCKTFEFIHEKFEQLWKKPLYQGSHPRLGRRCLNSRAALGITLFFLASAPPLVSICLFTRMSLSSVSCYLSCSIDILHVCLSELDECSVVMPSPESFSELSVKMAETYGDVMRGCVIVTDGSLHKLEKDDIAQNSFFFEDWHIDYNGFGSFQSFPCVLILFIGGNPFTVKKVFISFVLMDQLFGIQ